MADLNVDGYSASDSLAQTEPEKSGFVVLRDLVCEKFPEACSLVSLNLDSLRRLRSLGLPSAIIPGNRL